MGPTQQAYVLPEEYLAKIMEKQLPNRRMNEAQAWKVVAGGYKNFVLGILLEVARRGSGHFDTPNSTANRR